MTNADILQIALQQSAIDCNCSPSDFLRNDSIITESCVHPQARKYIPLPLECDLTSYGNNIVAQCSPRLMDAVGNFIRTYPTEHALETPHLHVLEEILSPYGLKVCFMAEYFLPDMDKFKVLPCSYEQKILKPGAFSGLYTAEWSNALCADRRDLDVLAVGAYDGEKLIGLAGCSADCETMYQIGVDVLPEYRRQGIAAALTTRLAQEILHMGKVPFYCAAWCNLKSVRNAFKCGFRPAWVEVTARNADFVDSLNKRGI